MEKLRLYTLSHLAHLRDQPWTLRCRITRPVLHDLSGSLWSIVWLDRLPLCDPFKFFRINAESFATFIEYFYDFLSSSSELRLTSYVCLLSIYFFSRVFQDLHRAYIFHPSPTGPTSSICLSLEFHGACVQCAPYVFPSSLTGLLWVLHAYRTMSTSTAYLNLNSLMLLGSST